MVWPPTPSIERIDLPAQRNTRDQRRVSVDARWTDDGHISGTVDDILSGHEAIVIGNYLASFEPGERIRLVEKLLVRAISAGHVTELEPINLDPNAHHLRGIDQAGW